MGRPLGESNDGGQKRIARHYYAAQFTKIPWIYLIAISCRELVVVSDYSISDGKKSNLHDMLL